MSDFYKTLGINNEASQQDIKKAYFSLVRKFPPDRNPDEFINIREAYETLSDPNTKAEYDKIGTLPEYVKIYYNNALEYISTHRFSKAIEVLEYILNFHPNLSIVKVLLGDAYLYNENSGKAINIFTEILNDEPKNAAFAGKLADAYRMRGWLKKAVAQYEKAIKLDQDNISFWLALIVCHSESGDIKKARAVCLKALEASRKSNWDNLPIYVSLVQFNMALGNSKEMRENIAEIKAQADSGIEEYENIAQLFKVLAGFLMSVQKDSDAKEMIETAYKFNPEDEEINSIKSFIEGKVNLSGEIRRLKNNKDIPKELFELFDAQINKCPNEECFECDANIFMCEFEIFTNYSKMKKYIPILALNYPTLYQLKKDFFDKLMSSIGQKQLKWELDKAAKKYLRTIDKMENDDFDEEDEFWQKPVRRDESKVGRNDPCSCGSGKKHKKCCGR